MRLDAEDEQEESEAAKPNVTTATAVQPPSEGPESRGMATAEDETLGAVDVDAENE
jgi:hypothetical protein